jgi:hypothetical protein
MFTSAMMMAAQTPEATVSFRASYTDAGSATAYTFSGADIGTAASDRIVVVTAVGSRAAAGTHTVASLTVAGNAASLVKQQNVPSGDRQTAEIWAVSLASGTTGNIVVTFDAGMQGAAIGVFAIYGANSTVSATAGSNADPMNASINVPAGGVLIGVGVNENGGTFTWANLTEKFDEQYYAGGGPSNHTGACDAFSSAQVGLSVTCDPSTAGSDNAMALAAWAPA